MEQAQKLQDWLEQDAYTRDDVLHIVGKELPFKQERTPTEKDINMILGPPPCAARSSRPSGTNHP